MRSREVRTVRILCVCVLVLCLIGLGTVVFGKTETSGKEVEQPSSKEMVLNLENDTEGSRIPAGYRENMIRLAIIRDGQTVFAIEKGPSENQEDFMEWYLTEPYETRQLVNVSDLYDFLDHYASWSCLGQVENVDFQESGLVVEETFSDTGTVRLIVGQTDEEGNYYVKADYSGNVYIVEKEQLETMTSLEPKDFMMGIANLVYLTTVKQLQMTTEKTSASFDIETDDNNRQTYTLDGRVLEEASFKELYGKIIEVLINGEAEEKEIETEEPVLSLCFKRNSGSLEDVVIRYFPYDRSHYLIEKNGHAEFLAEKKQVDELIEEIDRFCGK